MNTWPEQSTLTLAAVPDAAYWARRHLQDVLLKWHLEALLADAALVTTELVTNALKISGGLDLAARVGGVESSAGGSVEDDPALDGRCQPVLLTRVEKLQVVRLRLSAAPGRLLIEVWDRNEEPPEEQVPDFVSESGRGLFVVGAFSEAWGWYPTPAAGKVVWAELRESSSAVGQS
ncbi:ATP-binding protein [Actinomadura graeca]|uniref:ATP-binding protein n=1 Tax=Actinomadura graeca TaxID=2750812 RepID=A0ABX8QTR4_9ACTN|nr:ATP-binding protein [Actinomadura graeca]QXJ20183.1 ATP-binding protein [Actinomadura graeca]